MNIGNTVFKYMNKYIDLLVLYLNTEIYRT